LGLSLLACPDGGEKIARRSPARLTYARESSPNRADSHARPPSAAVPHDMKIHRDLPSAPGRQPLAASRSSRTPRRSLECSRCRGLYGTSWPRAAGLLGFCPVVCEPIGRQHTRPASGVSGSVAIAVTRARSASGRVLDTWFQYRTAPGGRRPMESAPTTKSPPCCPANPAGVLDIHCTECITVELIAGDSPAGGATTVRCIFVSDAMAPSWRRISVNLGARDGRFAVERAPPGRSKISEVP